MLSSLLRHRSRQRQTYLSILGTLQHHSNARLFSTSPLSSSTTTPTSSPTAITPILSSSSPFTSNDKHDDDHNGTKTVKNNSPTKNCTTTTIKAYLALAKAKLSALVVSTTAAGFVAAGGPVDIPVLTSCLVGTALCSSSAAAWNQIIEIPRDSLMKRTQHRPLVVPPNMGPNSITTPLLSKRQAQVAATVWGVGGTAILALGTDPVTTTLGLSNMVLYAGLYTWMKPRSVYNTWVGAVVGAIPPVMGYTAATAGAGWWAIEGWLLGTTLYLWQLPHFLALSYMHRVDYARGGFRMLPLVDEEQTSLVILKYTVYLSAIPLIATATDVTSSMFALEGMALNSYAMFLAYRFHQHRTNANARKIFLTSLWYLPSWLVLFLLHSKVWDNKNHETEDDSKELQHNWLHDTILHTVHRVRDVGRKACLHEQAIVVKRNTNETFKDKNDHIDTSDNDTAAECPIVIAKQSGVKLQAKATDVVMMETEATGSSLNGPT
jgi:heme o synthase